MRSQFCVMVLVYALPKSEPEWNESNNNVVNWQSFIFQVVGKITFLLFLSIDFNSPASHEIEGVSYIIKSRSYTCDDVSKEEISKLNPAKRGLNDFPYCFSYLEPCSSISTLEKWLAAIN